MKQSFIMANVKRKNLKLAIGLSPKSTTFTSEGNVQQVVTKVKIKEKPGKKNPPIYSPMTDLAMNMWELKTAGPDLTPKRKLSMSSTPTPKGQRAMKPVTLDRHMSFSSAFLESPNMASPVLESPMFQEKMMYPAKLLGSNQDKKTPFQSSALARFGRLPIPFADSPVKEDSPLKNYRDEKSVVDDDETSRDSGVCFDSSAKSAKEDLSFHFAEPNGPAPRRNRLVFDDACSPTAYSPLKDSPMRTLSFANLNFDTPDSIKSPVSLKKNSLTHSAEQEDGDDGFLDLVELDDDKVSDVPAGFDNLLTGAVLDKSTPLQHKRLAQIENQENIKPKGFSSRRGLFRSPSVPARLSERSCFNTNRVKRSVPDHPCDDTPVAQTKRKRSNADVSSDAFLIKNVSEKPSRPLHKAQSEAQIKDALSRLDQQQDLIADYSKPYCLPLINGKHKDLKSISPDTMAALQNGEYDHVVEKAIIVDCRYPYEFEGGHLKDAMNIYTKDGIMDEFVKSDKHKPAPNSQGRTIIIFHCEFSSERGPKMSRFLREHDRASNKECYPALDYPEIYLLEGGYKAFFTTYQDMCDPPTYKPMLHENHSADLKHFRAKSKSWAGEKGRGRSFRSGLKF